MKLCLFTPPPRHSSASGPPLPPQSQPGSRAEAPPSPTNGKQATSRTQTGVPRERRVGFPPAASPEPSFRLHLPLPGWLPPPPPHLREVSAGPSHGPRGWALAAWHGRPGEREAPAQAEGGGGGAEPSRTRRGRRRPQPGSQPANGRTRQPASAGARGGREAPPGPKARRSSGRGRLGSSAAS